MAILINGGTNDILIDGESVATDAEVTAQIGAIPVVGDASETAKGIIEIATNAEVQTGTDAVKAVTPAGLLSAVIGLGQTWQDVTGSRAVGVTYTNTTGKSIVLNFCGANTVNGNIIVNSTVVASIVFQSSYATQGTISVVIPAGATYSVSAGAFSRWVELR